jgi:hypothetical protein
MIFASFCRQVERRVAVRIIEVDQRISAEELLYHTENK